MRVLSKDRVISRLTKSYPSFENSVLTWEDDLDGTRIRVSTENGIVDRNGDLIFDANNLSDRYTFGVISHLWRWLDRNGWTPEWINNGEIHLWKQGHHGW